MTAIDIRLRPTNDLDDWELSQLRAVFAEGFDTLPDVAPDLEPYLKTIAGVLIARQGPTIMGFQFYQQVVVEGRRVHHFSLSAKRRIAPHGLQMRLGRRVIARAILRTAPWRPIYIAGCTNDVRAYANFHRLGPCFPDVEQPGRANPFGEWYFDVSRRLGFQRPDASGRLPSRMAAMRFGLRSVEIASTLGDAYRTFVGGDLRIGVFVMIEARVWRDLPKFVWGSLNRGIRQRVVAA